MFARDDWSAMFWAAMLMVCSILSPVLALLAQAQVSVFGSPASDKSFQTTLFMSVFLAMLGLLAMRLLIGRALDQNQKRHAYALAGFSLVSSAALIAYGLASMG